MACAAGSHRCWEAFASERAAIARYAKLKNCPTAARIDFGRLVCVALEGEEEARLALKETAYYLGLGIATP